MGCNISINASSAKSKTSSSKMANNQGYAAYPPRVEQVETLGYIEEVSGIFHSRDIGRSFELFGNIYLIFGDTFCNDSDGNFVGLANNTVAIIENADKPLKSRYLETEENEFIKPFIPLTLEEQQLEKEKKGRVALWAFGGVVEMEDGSGRLWYQKSVDHGCGNLEYHGTGVAKTTESSSPDQQPTVERKDTLVFGPDEPRMGTFTAIAEGDYLYLYGDRPDGKIILARVYNGHQEDHLGEKEAHYYWDGTDWAKDWHSAVPVIEGMQQGAIVRSTLFGEDKPFVFVGTSKWADSKVFMGASATLQGPWELNPVCEVDGIKVPKCEGKWMYCIYPHLWASTEEKAEVVISWSEQWPGGVVAARLKLAAVADGEDVS